MRKTSMYLIGASLASVAVAFPATVVAQDEMPGEEVALSAEQQAVFDGWPPDQQYAYGTWPSETKNYYWSLSPERQELFWRLSDDDKIAITAMTGTERDSAWETIEASTAAPSEPAEPG
ncbi:MAG: hypothetical protein AAF250_12540 [Pseudomonadota bacterium]